MLSRALFGAWVLVFAGTTPPTGENTGPVEPVTVIVSPNVEVTSISKAELSKIFLGRLRTWSSGERARPVDQLPESEARREFSKLVHGRSVVNIEVYWKRMIFSGRGVPPPERPSDQEVVAFVRNNPGAVGYVVDCDDLGGARRVTLTE